MKEKIAQITPSLPPGVDDQAVLRPQQLIERTIGTLKTALTEEIILVALAHIVFLWHFRSILIVTLPLPVSILISFILMRQFGITSNIMSLSGIAIAIGVLVDAGIVHDGKRDPPLRAGGERKSGSALTESGNAGR